MSTSQNQKKIEKFKTPLTAQELRVAEKELIIYTQKQTFGEVFEALSKKPSDDKSGKKANDGESSKKTSDVKPGKKILRDIKLAPDLATLNPGIIDGTLRVMGRLQNSPVHIDIRSPIIIPKGHLNDLLIRDCHIRAHHSGAPHTWNLIRERYWLIGRYATVKKLVNKCITCRKQLATAMTQQMADLPRERVTPDEPPFTSVGIDLFGPYQIKSGRSLVKRWVLIVTCANSRAVHLEIVHSLEAASFISALRRVMARRGRIKIIYCDNATNFTSANRILCREMKLWNASEISSFGRQQDIEFRFNPPTASNFGGFYERLIRSAKRVLSSILHEQVVSDESLLTIFCEVENQLNSRPLTPIVVDHDSETVITPNHLLLFRPQANMPPGLFDKKDNYPIRRWRQVQFLANLFWRRWTREYLTTLQKRQKWHKVKQNLQENDLVLVVDNLQPRGKWNIAKVVQTKADKRGLVREVLLRTPHGQIRRPINKLCLLSRAKAPA